MFYYKDAFGPSWACPQKPVMFLSKNFKGISAVYSQPVARDAPLPWQITFQDPATPGMEGVIDLHHEIMFYIIIIITFVLWMLVRTVVLFNSSKLVLPYSTVTHHVELE
jgi:heme/copper-type cytochrome/quinol oxidase subunit 2